MPPTEPWTPKDLVGPKTMARRLDLRVDWLLAEADAGRLPHTKCGDRIFFNSDAVVEELVRRARETVLRVTGRNKHGVIVDQAANDRVSKKECNA